MLVSKIPFVFSPDTEQSTVVSEMLIEDEPIIEAHYICSTDEDGVRQLVLMTESEEIVIRVTAQQAAEFGIDEACKRNRTLKCVQSPRDPAGQNITSLVPLIYHRSMDESINYAMKAYTGAG